MSILVGFVTTNPFSIYDDAGKHICSTYNLQKGDLKQIAHFL